MNKIIMIFFVGILNLNAQVGINTEPPHVTAALDMSDSGKGFLAPRVSLQGNRDTSTISQPRKGLLVFNTTNNATMQTGYYYWNNEKWDPFYNTSSESFQTISETIFASSLGYVPSGDYELALTELSYYGATSLKRDCFQFTDTFNGAVSKTYCGYTMEGTITWEQAFYFAKYLKGYLATITSTDEWNAIRTNLLTLGANANNNIWIGYNTIQSPGNPREYNWITGERSVINWSNSSVLQVNYAPGEPDTTTGCVHISSSTTSANRNWYNAPCNTTTANGAPFNYLIVEFHN